MGILPQAATTWAWTRFALRRRHVQYYFWREKRGAAGQREQRDEQTERLDWRREVHGTDPIPDERLRVCLSISIAHSRCSNWESTALWLCCRPSKTTMTIRPPERLEELLNELKPLLLQHWQPSSMPWKRVCIPRSDRLEPGHDVP